MALKDALLPEFDHEMGTTRRLLERVPEADLAWKPHDKSFSLGQLASHIANIPHWVDVDARRHACFDVATARRGRAPEAADVGRATLLKTFDANVKSGAREDRRPDRRRDVRASGR